MSDAAVKVCRSCSQELPIERFAPYRKVDPTKRRNFCRECNAVSALIWRINNRERHLQNAASWHADRPGYNQRYYRANREHILARCAKRRADKSDHIKAYLRQHYLSNKQQYRNRTRRYRARKIEATVEVFTNDELLAFWAERGVDAKVCFYCGDPWQHLDHVIPLSRGGLHERANLVPACQPCNDSKGTKTPEEWLNTDA